MTIEDFAESVIAGWVPLVWHTIWHELVVTWRWLIVQVTVAVAVRLPRRW